MAEPGQLQRLAALLDSRRRWLFLAAYSMGFLAAMGQAPFNFFPAALLGLSGGYALFRAAPTLARASLAGWGLGAGYFSLTFIWVVQPFLVDPWRHGWMAPFALILMAGGFALFWAAGFAGARWLAPGRWGWLGWAAAMSAAELARGVVLTGFPWGGPGAVWVNTPVMQLAAYVGASGLSFLTFLFVAGLYTALTGKRRVLPTGLVLGAAALGLWAGIARDHLALEMPGDPLILRLVQPNAAQHLKWHPDHAPGFLERQLEFTALPPEPVTGPPDLVIWPETAVPYLLERAGDVLPRIAAASDAPVILGIQRREAGRYYNSALVLGKGGTIEAMYDKHHLVPFGEYIPGGGLLHRLGLRGFAAQHGYGYSPGPGAQVLDLGEAGKVLPLICYEAIFARDLRAASERPAWVLQLTNDAWFGTFSGPQQHLVQAQLRAVEMGLPLVRVANTGVSAVINAQGHITARIGLGFAAALDAPLPSTAAPTPYWRAGDAPLTLVLILIGAGLFLARGRKIPIDPGPGRK